MIILGISIGLLWIVFITFMVYTFIKLTRNGKQLDNLERHSLQNPNKSTN